jgi:hypothetical protein
VIGGEPALPINPDISSIAEAVMLVCFGASWPFSVVKAIRVKKVTGKSPIFLFLVLFGYVAGMISKTCRWDDPRSHWLLLLYIYNFSIVGVDTILYFRYRKNG